METKIKIIPACFIFLLGLVLSACQENRQDNLAGNSLPLHSNIEPLEDEAENKVENWKGYEKFDANIRIMSNTNSYNALGMLDYLENNVVAMKANVPEHLQIPAVRKSIRRIQLNLDQLKAIVENGEISRRKLKRKIDAIYDAVNQLHGTINDVAVHTM